MTLQRAVRAGAMAVVILVILAGLVLGLTAVLTYFAPRWNLVGKFVIPPIITGVIAVFGFAAAFYVNDGLKRRELLYKEQIESVKAILNQGQKLAEKTNQEINDNIDYDEYSELLDDYLGNYSVVASAYLPLLKPMSRYASMTFNARIRRVRDSRHSLLLEGKHLSMSYKGNETIQYHSDLMDVVMYILTMTDVLYRDLKMPGWSPQFPDYLKKFDDDYQKYQAGLKENQSTQ